MRKVDLDTLANETMNSDSTSKEGNDRFPRSEDEELFADEGNSLYDLRRIDTARPVKEVLKELLEHHGINLPVASQPTSDKPVFY